MKAAIAALAACADLMPKPTPYERAKLLTTLAHAYEEAVLLVAMKRLEEIAAEKKAAAKIQPVITAEMLGLAKPKTRKKKAK
jgi:hypothetical protein